MEEGKPFFDAWMYELSDEQQALATAFGERYVLEAALEQYKRCTHTGVKELLYHAIMLHSLTLVQQHIGWYLTHGIVSVEAAEDVEIAQLAAVKAFVPYMNTAVEGLGLLIFPDYNSPIARDYVAFNQQDDNENLHAAGPLFDFRTTGMPRAKL